MTTFTVMVPQETKDFPVDSSGDGTTTLDNVKVAYTLVLSGTNAVASENFQRVNQLLNGSVTAALVDSTSNSWRKVK